MANGIFNIKDDFSVAVSMGLVNGVRAFSLYGAAEGLVADTQKDLTNLPVDIIPLPDNAGESLEIVSDAADTSTISISALGPNGAFLEDFTIQLNGTTPVPIPGDISRINTAVCISDVGFDGNVSIRQAGGGTVFGVLIEANQQLNQAHYSVPAGHKWILSTLIGAMQKSSGVDADAVPCVRFKGLTQQKWVCPFGFGLQRSGDTSVEFADKYPVAGTGPTDIKISATSSATGTTVSGRISGLIFENTTGDN